MTTKPRLRRYKTDKCIELDKRQYMPGFSLEDNCPKCGELVRHDFGSNHYLSYPVVGEPCMVYMYCAGVDSTCHTEWQIPVIVEMKLKLA